MSMQPPQDGFKQKIIMGIGNGIGIAVVGIVLAKFLKLRIQQNPKWIKKN
mgnify:CR=1 FL=1